jgi:hypothetical protein
MKRTFGILLALAAAVLPVGTAAAAPAAAWSITAEPFPTNFAPGSAYDKVEAGPAYQIQAFNVGGAPTNGVFTITDPLPGSLAPVAGFPAAGFYGPPTESALAFKMNCTTSGRTVTCSSDGVHQVGPGEAATVEVPVEVAPAAPPVLVDRATVSGGGAVLSKTAFAPTTISSEPAAFGFTEGEGGLFGLATDAEGSASVQAGSHPYQLTVAAANFPTDSNSPGFANLLAAGGGIRDVVATLPHGEVINPGATPVLCTESELTSIAGCPLASQIGTIALTLSVGKGLGEEPAMRPLYLMVPPPGSPASLGFEVVSGTYVHLLGSVSSDGTYTLSAHSNDILAKVAIAGVRTTLWGDPSDESHDAQRGTCIYATRSQATCPVARLNRAFVTLPSACQGPLVTELAVDSWLQPGAFVRRSYESTDPEGNPVGIGGCGALQFQPTIQARPTTTVTDSASGLDFDLHQLQNEKFGELATANLRDARVTLPAGMALNPAAGNGLAACTPAQIGLTTATGQSPIRFREEAQSCPNAAKIGTAEVTTPLLKEPSDGGAERAPRVLQGSVYLAKPFDNPFDSLLAIYLAVEDPQTGIIAKLAGKVEADPGDGQLTTTFSENPQLPLEDVKLHLFGGDRASLTTPLTCGTKTTTSVLTPWSSPQAADATPSDSFDTSTAPGGGSCPATESQAPDHPDFVAGTATPTAGTYSPFILKLSRGDGSQRLSAIDTTLPEGVLGRLAGIPYCPESSIARGQSLNQPNRGAIEQQSPSCPAASQVGTVTVGAGSGESPLFVQGRVYLAGPYKAAPLSLVIMTPAIAGPFDLGDVVTRVALEVEPFSAQIHAVSDPLPTILQGIPLDVRSIALDMDRAGFTLNPTSCEPMAVTGSAISPAGNSAGLASRFQVGGCRSLGFRPKVEISLKGATKRSGHPALKAVVTYPKKGAYANIARAQVGLPHSEFLDQGNIGTVCTQAQLKAAACPKKSIYGKAKAWTPLLEKPLEGPVYLGVGFGHKLPDLVADLNGQVRILLHGKVDTTSHKGIRNTFETVPDAPVSRFVLELKGGPKFGLLENSENICRRAQHASAVFVAQNGIRKHLTPRIANSCRAKKKKAHKRRRH